MASIHRGHRARMRERYFTGGSENMQTHELLEMLLYFVIPQKDVNPLAHALLHRFGSLDGVFRASKDALCEVEGVGERVAAFLTENGRSAAEIVSAPLWESEAPVYDNYHTLGEFFVSYFGKHGTQATVALLLDAGMHEISLFELAPLDFGSAGVRAEAAIAKAISLGATVIVLAHNHPYGPAYPSHSDVVSSQVMDKSFSECGVLLLEHYVISGADYVGFHHRFGVKEGLGDAVRAFLESKEAAADV